MSSDSKNSLQRSPGLGLNALLVLVHIPEQLWESRSRSNHDNNPASDDE